MKLFSIDKNYFDYIFNKVDNEVMFSHTEEPNRGRANVIVMRTQYKGQYLDFAIPEIGDISHSKFEGRDYVSIVSQKQYGKNSSGFVVAKLMPIESTLLVPFNIETSSNFRQIATEITHKEPELIEKTKAHLTRIERNGTFKFSTNIDKQLKFLNARAELLNQGVAQKEIYDSSFECNILRAETFKQRDKRKQLTKQYDKSKDFDLEK